MTRILVIENDTNLQNMICQSLEENGYEVVIASDGKEGITRISNYNPHCVITDIHTQIRNGLDIILEIQNNYQTIPVIAIYNENQKDMPDLLATASRFGAYATFSLPSENNELIKKINNAFKPK